jgi:hypothetical protein
MVAHQAVVLQSRVRIRRLPSPQLIANLLVGCHPGMALGCGLTSVRGNRGKNYENEPLVPQKHTKKKKNISTVYCKCALGMKIKILGSGLANGGLIEPAKKR